LICQDYLSDRAATDPNFRTLPIILGDQNEQCRDAHVQSLVARFQLYSALLSGIFSAIVAPYLGALSDRVGRKKIIAFSTLGIFIENIICIVVGNYPQTISVYWLLAGFVIDGLCGSFTSVMSVSLAYASDSTPPERRNVAIGYFHGTLFAGIAIGPILAGLLMKMAGTILITFYFSIGCHLFFFIFLFACIPESLSKGRQMHSREKYRISKEETQAQSWWSTIKTYNLFEPLSILRPTGPGTSNALRRNLSLLAAIDTIMFGVAMGAMGVLLIYPQYIFGWDPIQASEFLSITNICRVVGLVIILPLVTRLFRRRRRRPVVPAGQQSGGGHYGADMLDIRIVRVAILLDLVGYVGYATAMTSGMMVAAAMVAAFAGIGSPTLSAAITAHVPPDRTGQVLGALGLLHALAKVMAPTIFNTIYGLTVGVFPQAVFVCLGSLFLVVFVLSWFLRPGGESSSHPYHHSLITDITWHM
jgi:MFS family permease